MTNMAGAIAKAIGATVATTEGSMVTSIMRTMITDMDMDMDTDTIMIVIVTNPR